MIYYIDTSKKDMMMVIMTIIKMLLSLPKVIFISVYQNTLVKIFTKQKPKFKFLNSYSTISLSDPIFKSAKHPRPKCSRLLGETQQVFHSTQQKLKKNIRWEMKNAISH